MNVERLFSYKLAHDSGFAPNPWWGYLTLATCKPGMRSTKRAGDWIAGFTSGTLCGDAVGNERLVYLMQIAEVLPIAQYYQDRRFAAKIPLRNAKDRRSALGDNIYRPLTANPVTPPEFRQIRNVSHGQAEMARDLSGRNVLVAKTFAYFGRSPLEVPARYRPEVPKGQSRAGQRTRDTQRAAAFVEFVRNAAGLDAVVRDWPHTWSADRSCTRNGSSACTPSRSLPKPKPRCR